MNGRFFVKMGLLGTLAAVAVIAGCDVDVADVLGAEHTKTNELTVPMAHTRILAVEGKVGAITVTGANTGECSVVAEITVKAGSPEKAAELAEEVGIEVEPSGDKLYVRVARPEGLKDRALTVDFTITAPYDVNLVCSTDVGSLTISGMTGPIEASNDVGAIKCTEAVGKVALKSNVGSITLTYSDSAPSSVEAIAKTNMGVIEFTGPPKLSATVSASTNVGSVQTTRSITVSGKMGKSIEGTVGGGEGSISLQTNVGSIQIR